MVFRLINFDMTFNSALGADWTYETDHLANLLSDDPASYADITQAAIARRRA
jgi:hypothetical protein